MAYTTTDLATLNTAIASGTKRVRYADKEVEYNSLADMLRLRVLMQREISGQTQPRFQVADFSDC